jgi:hypothetical protein
VKLKLMAIIYAKKTNNYKAARKFSVAEVKVQRWKEQKQKLINTNSTKKIIQWPQAWTVPRIIKRNC